MKKSKVLDFFPAVVVALMISAVYLLTANCSGDFWWSDAERHAMDGVFFLDFFTDLPLLNAEEYAYEYFVRYPALSILFYPPIFAFFEAIFFSILGVSHFAAQFTVSFFVFFTAYGLYVLARRWLPIEQSIAVMLFFFSFNEVALWGRQVMLELPAYAFLIWSILVLFKYLETKKARYLYFFAIIFGCGINTKLNIVFIFPIVLLVLFATGGLKIFKNRSILQAGILLFIIVLPWALVTLNIGQVNMGAVVGGQSDNELSRWSWSSLTYYLQLLPNQVGWLTLVFSGLFPFVFLFTRSRKLAKSQYFTKFLFLWFCWGYTFFTLISLKEPRHSLFILLPLSVFAVLSLHSYLRREIASILALSCGLYLFVSNVIFHPPPAIAGHERAVHVLSKHMPEAGVILFSGYRDGSFIFHSRILDEKAPWTILRSEKVFFDMTIKRSMGVKEFDLTEQEIQAVLDKYGVRYVVSQPSYFSDLGVMQRFNKVVRGTAFTLVDEIDLSEVVDNISVNGEKLMIYKNISKNIEKYPGDISINVGAIGKEIKGKLLKRTDQ